MPDYNTQGYFKKAYDSYRGRYGDDAGTFETFVDAVNSDNNIRQALFDDLKKHGELNDTWDFDNFSSVLGDEYNSTYAQQRPQFQDEPQGKPVQRTIPAEIQERYAQAFGSEQRFFPQAERQDAPTVTPPYDELRTTPEDRARIEGFENYVSGIGQGVKGDFNTYRQQAGRATTQQALSGMLNREMVKDAERKERTEFYKGIGLKTKEDGSLDYDAINDEAKKKIVEYGGLRSGVYDPQDHGTGIFPEDQIDVMQSIDDHRHASAYDLVSKYARLAKGLEKTAKGEMGKFRGGFTNTTVENIFSMGIAEAADIFKVADLAKKLANGQELYPEEQQAVVLYGTNQALMDALSKDEKWFRWGQTIRDSAEMVLQLGLTGGTSTGIKATGKAVVKTAKNLAKNIASKEAIAGVAKNVGDKLLSKFTKEGVKEFLNRMGNAYMRDMGLAFATPLTYRSIANQVKDLYDFGEGYDDNGEYGVFSERNDKSVAGALYKGLIQGVNERFSESLGGIVSDHLRLGRFIKSPLGEKLFKKVSKYTGMGDLKWNKMRKTIQKVGLNEAPVEVFEEVANNILNAGMTLDKDSIEQLKDADFYTDVLATSAVLGGAGTMMKAGASAVGKYEYRKRKQRNLNEAIDSFVNRNFNPEMGGIPQTSDGKIDIESSNLKANTLRGRFVDAVKKEQFVDKNGEFAGGEAFRAFGEIKDYVAEGEKLHEEGKLSDKGYVERFNFGVDAQNILYDALQNFGGSEVLAEELEGEIGAFRNRINGGENVVLVRDKNDGSLKYLIDNKGEISLVRDAIEGGEVKDMKAEDYVIDSITPIDEFVNQVYSYGLATAQMMASVRGEADAGVQGYNAMQNPQQQAEAQLQEQPQEQPAEQQAVEGAVQEGAEETPQQPAAPQFNIGDTVEFDGVQAEILDISEDGTQATIQFLDDEGGTDTVPINMLLPKAPEGVATGVASEVTQPVVPTEQVPTEEVVTPEVTSTEEVPIEQPTEEAVQAELPRTKEGDVDFDVLMEQNPLLFMEEYDKALGQEGKGRELIQKNSDKIQAEIDKTQKALDKEITPNKVISLTRKLNELSERKQMLDAVLKPEETVADIVESALGEEMPEEAKEAIEEIRNPQAEETPATEEVKPEPVAETTEEVTEPVAEKPEPVEEKPEVSAEPVAIETFSDSDFDSIFNRVKRTDGDLRAAVKEIPGMDEALSNVRNAPKVAPEKVESYKAELIELAKKYPDNPVSKAILGKVIEAPVEAVAEKSEPVKETPKAEEKPEKKETKKAEKPKAQPKSELEKRKEKIDKKFTLYSYAEKGKKNLEYRPEFGGVYLDPEGWAVASDTHQIVASKDSYNPDYAGKVIGKDGEEIKSKSGRVYPDWQSAIRRGDEKKINFDYKGIYDKIDKLTESRNNLLLNLDALNMKKKDIGLRVPITYENKVAWYNGEMLQKFVDAMLHYGAKPSDFQMLEGRNGVKMLAVNGDTVRGALMNMKFDPKENDGSYIYIDPKTGEVVESEFLKQAIKENPKGEIKKPMFSRELEENAPLSVEEQRTKVALNTMLSEMGFDVITEEADGKEVLKAYKELARMMRVWHGSGYQFELFDFGPEHMGTGEGLQAYGYGGYFTAVKGIGRTYALANARISPEVEAEIKELSEEGAKLEKEYKELRNAVSDKRLESISLSRKTESIKYLNKLSDKEYDALWKVAGKYLNNLGKAREEIGGYLANLNPEQRKAFDFLVSKDGKAYNEVRYKRGVLSVKEDLGEFQKSFQERADKAAEEWLKSLDELDEHPTTKRYNEVRKKLYEVRANKKQSFLYQVEIPDDNGENYITYEKQLSAKQQEQLKDAIRKRLLEDPDSGYDESVLKELNQDLDIAINNIYGNDVEGTIRDFLGYTPEEASKFLSELGYVGIRYPAEFRTGGRKDGKSNFVIFKENDAKIKNRYKLFKSDDGSEVFGFTVGNKIYIDPKAPAETVLHEYAHTWLEMYTKINPGEKKNLVNLAKQTTLWEKVKATYPELTSDDDIAEEVIAHYSGKRGTERLKEEIKKITSDKTTSAAFKMRALKAIEKFRRALEKFWRQIAEYFGMKFTTAEEVADTILADFVRKVNPNEVVKKVEASNRQYAKAEEVLKYFNSKGFKDGEIVRSISDHGVSTYIYGDWGNGRLAKYRISDHPFGSYRDMSEVQFGLNDTPKDVYERGHGDGFGSFDISSSGENIQRRINGQEELDRTAPKGNKYEEEYKELWNRNEQKVKGFEFLKLQSKLQLDEAIKKYPFLGEAKYLQQRRNRDGVSFTYEYSRPKTNPRWTGGRPTIGMLRAIDSMEGPQKPTPEKPKTSELKANTEKPKVEEPKAEPVKFSKGLKDVAEESQKEVVEKITEAKAVRKSRLDEIDKKLKALNKKMVASAQRGYDQATVKSITDLAKELMEEGLIDNPSKMDMQKVLTLLSHTTGKENLTTAVNRLMDIMATNQIRNYKNLISRLMKTRASRLNQSGVRVMSKLDASGQAVMKTLKEWKDADISQIESRITELQDQLGEDTKLEDIKEEWTGLYLAKEFAELKQIESEDRSFRQQLEDKRKALYKQYQNGNATYKQYRDFAETARKQMLDSRLRDVELYMNLASDLAKTQAASALGAKLFRSEELDRVEKIHHFANSDMEGRKSTTFEKPSTRDKKFTNNVAIRTILQPLATFDTLLRFFGQKNVRGEGYLWNHFFRGYMDASDKEATGLFGGLEQLGKRASSILGKDSKWTDLYKLSNKKIDATLRFFNEGEWHTVPLTQGNAMYLYMVNKMEDGATKLRAMGITDEDIEKLASKVDPSLISLADWLQEEFFPELQKKYDKVYRQMFGAPMGNIDNYVPLRILKGSVSKQEEIGAPDIDGLPSSITGGVIERTKNANPIDILNTDAISLALEHLQEMEHWAAFAPLIKDLNTLLSYKKFKNRVQNMNSIYGAGNTLWKNFYDSARMAVGSYVPKGSQSVVDKNLANIAKGVTMAKIALRVNTAIKQLLSAPAYFSDTNPAILVKNMATPGAAFKWCLENLPNFKKRWKSRIAGETRLMDTKGDWDLWKNDTLQKLSRAGVTPNAFVDAVTVAIGAKSIYETRYKRYIKEGYAPIVADKKAKQDAEILPNETQQSSEGGYTSTVQVDKTFAALAISVFRNASMGYGRQMVDAIRNLKRMATPGYKKESIDFMTKQMVREGIPEDQARENAEKRFNRDVFRNIFRVELFGFGLTLLWNFANSMWYVLMGDDDEKKKQMVEENVAQSLTGPLEGLSFGNVASEAWRWYLSGKSLSDYNPQLLPLMSDIQSIRKTWKYDKASSMNNIINLLVQMGIGVNPQTLEDMALAIYDAANGDLGTMQEIEIALLRLINAPQTQIDQLLVDEVGVGKDEAMKMGIDELAERYANYKYNRGATATGWAADEAEKKKRLNYYKNQFKGKVEERKALRASEEEKAYPEIEKKFKTLEQIRKDLQKDVNEAKTPETKADAQMKYNEFINSPEYRKYAKVKGVMKAAKKAKELKKKYQGAGDELLDEILEDMKKDLVEELNQENK